MTPSYDHIAPPHMELLDAPAVRPFNDALAETRARWDAEVARYRERTVFTDQQLSVENSAKRD
jgi:hypothetical protein